MDSEKVDAFSKGEQVMVHRDGSTISLLRGTDCSPARMALPAKLDSFSHFPHINVRLVHISRVVGRYGHGD
jgi:hypothetical protein